MFAAAGADVSADGSVLSGGKGTFHVSELAVRGK